MMRPSLPLLLFLALLGWGLLSTPLEGAETPVVRELRVQKVGEILYFHARIEKPPELLAKVDRKGVLLRLPLLVMTVALPSGLLPKSVQGILDPRLVPQDGVTQRVHRWIDPTSREKEPRPPAPFLDFVGKARNRAEAKLLLLYPREDRTKRKPGETPRIVWVEAPVTLAMEKAKEVPVPKEAGARKSQLAPPQGRLAVRDDLEGLWAEAQVQHFDSLREQRETFAGDVSLSVPGPGIQVGTYHEKDFGFFRFATEATARKYGVRTPPDPQGGKRKDEQGRTDQHLFDATISSATVAEASIEQRLSGVVKEDEPRTVDPARLPGIDASAHPWNSMLKDRKRIDDALARFVPHDNYFIAFPSVRKFVETAEVVDQWGPLGRDALTGVSRDYRLRARYEQQFALKIASLTRVPGIRGIALTGSDLYVREGSDVAVLFHVKDRTAFLQGVEPSLAEVRKKFGPLLKESKTTYQGATIENFVTPLREISMHRTVFDDHVIYCNSLAGLRRILDASQGRSKRLSDSLEFQYLRSAFREEETFLHLPDAFHRRVNGPACKITEKRRGEALTTLTLLTQGALFTAWETGKLPASHRALIENAHLKPKELPVAEGKPAAWDAERRLALSEVYGSLHFATPLLELPLERVTGSEAEAYGQFRAAYRSAWHGGGGPLGVRLTVNDEQLTLEALLLPSVQPGLLAGLRRVTGEGALLMDVSNLSPRTRMQFVWKLSPSAQDRLQSLSLIPGVAPLVDKMKLPPLLGAFLEPVGEWVLVRVGASPVYDQLVGWMERATLGKDDQEEWYRLMFQRPLALGFHLKNPLTFATVLTAFRLEVIRRGLVTWEVLEKPYKGVPIVRIQPTDAVLRALAELVEKGKIPRIFKPAAYYALVENGFYATTDEKMLHDFIDEARARQRKPPDTAPVSASFTLAPGKGEHEGRLLRRIVRGEMTDRALGDAPLWQALYSTGVLGSQTGSVRADTVYHYLGFVPVSLDGTAPRYASKTDEVFDERHGSLGQPRLPRELVEGSPVERFLNGVESLRADVKVVEEGVRLTLTIRKTKPD